MFRRRSLPSSSGTCGRERSLPSTTSRPRIARRARSGAAAAHDCGLSASGYSTGTLVWSRANPANTSGSWVEKALRNLAGLVAEAVPAHALGADRAVVGPHGAVVILERVESSVPRRHRT